jgi:hypothetical protein
MRLGKATPESHAARAQDLQPVSIRRHLLASGEQAVHSGVECLVGLPDDPGADGPAQNRR